MSVITIRKSPRAAAQSAAGDSIETMSAEFAALRERRTKVWAQFVAAERVAADRAEAGAERVLAGRVARLLGVSAPAPGGTAVERKSELDEIDRQLDELRDRIGAAKTAAARDQWVTQEPEWLENRRQIAQRIADIRRLCAEGEKIEAIGRRAGAGLILQNFGPGRLLKQDAAYFLDQAVTARLLDRKETR
jgi:hypothetical protein